jgi:hypothetical protein
MTRVSGLAGLPMHRACAVLIVLFAAALVGCSSAATPAPQASASTPVVATAALLSAPIVTPPAPTATPTPTTAAPTPPEALSGQAGVTTAITEPGTLGLTLSAFVKRWNSVLDQGQYPLKGAPTRDKATFMFTPEGADNTVVLGVLNDDGTIRAVDALSVAGGINDKIDRMMAQLEGLVIWSTLGRAANPRLSEAEGNQLLTQIGLPVSADFGTLDPAVLDLKGVRYYIIEGDTTTNFIARQSN